MTRRTMRWIVGLGAGSVVAVGTFLWLHSVGNDTGLDDFRRNQPSLTAAEAGDRDPNEVAAMLVDRWLSRFTTGEFGRATRLHAFRIERVETLPAGPDTHVVSARVSLRPTRASLDNWLAGSGGTVEEGWIHGKFLRFALSHGDGQYRLREVGPSPL